MNDRLLTNLDEGEIVETEDGCFLVCVPDSYTDSNKALTDGDVWICEDSQLRVKVRLVEPEEYPILIDPDLMETFRFLLYRARSQKQDHDHFAMFHRKARYVSLN